MIFENKYFCLKFKKRMSLSKEIKAINELTVNQIKTKVGFYCNCFDRFGHNYYSIIYDLRRN
jgi:hypothetical protein